jgi:hypothetical protein
VQRARRRPWHHLTFTLITPLLLLLLLAAPASLPTPSTLYPTAPPRQPFTSTPCAFVSSIHILLLLLVLLLLCTAAEPTSSTPSSSSSSSSGTVLLLLLVVFREVLWGC